MSALFCWYKVWFSRPSNPAELTLLNKRKFRCSSRPCSFIALLSMPALRTFLLIMILYTNNKKVLKIINKVLKIIKKFLGNESRVEQNKFHVFLYQSGNQESESDTPKQDTIDAAQLMRCEHPLNEAEVFLRPLQNLSPQFMRTHILAFEIYYRKG